ncbi:MOSC domain-containing protein [Actinokineospora sp. NBRC 105648]|uniref:MOSC domain-containing protein n=1 Tax=Actinokineospora sp. NBRC 105648 TaxID=3032206 RepID=UPI0024A310EC|nr:MOSC domain-containing protein [Actinokineospora sp. NBRC 105648]GLZ36909.1 sulfurase [Actinokineospora sp. NBRC 105648]
MPAAAVIESVNVGVPRPIPAKAGASAIDKRPVAGPVQVSVPAAGRSGLAGDSICDTDHHGGADQAVYAYAREDLAWWSGELGAAFGAGAFGENLTTAGLDVNGALVGETWRVGADLLLRVTTPRIPCRTFGVWLRRSGWARTFTRAARPGTYLSVLRPGAVRAGDTVEVVDRPDHGVTVAMVFRAITLEADLLPRLLTAEHDLPPELVDTARRRAGVSR